MLGSDGPDECIGTDQKDWASTYVLCRLAVRVLIFPGMGQEWSIVEHQGQ
jgi:hypothetical protein